MSTVFVAMSGGVDSSVAAAVLQRDGHDVVGVTMKLWGGPSDTGCCSVADVDDARRVAQQLGIPHYVFDFGDDFTAAVVEPYVAAHAAGRTPNPCVECNRSIKFDRLLRRADALGIDLVATGHHARIEAGSGGRGWRLRRGADAAKDQSYVLHMLGQSQLRRVRLPVGDLTKESVRALAAELGLRTAAKPDSQDVCFIPTGTGRRGFLADRLAFTPGRVVDTSGAEVGSVDAIELVTTGQRKGLGTAGGAAARFAVAVDVGAGTVTVGGESDLLARTVDLVDTTWVDGEPAGPVLVQTSAHGRPVAGSWEGGTVTFEAPVRRVAPGQSVALYDGDVLLGGGVAA